MTVLAAAVLALACHPLRTGSEAAPPTASDAGAAISPAGDAGVAPARSQIARATTDICTLVTPEAVSTSFRSNPVLRTAPMGEAHGPACGYPHPDHGGYLLVIQFRTLESWETADTTGTVVSNLGVPARVDSRSGRGSVALFVRDETRGAVVMFLAPEGPPDAVLRVASLIYQR